MAASLIVGDVGNSSLKLGEFRIAEDEDLDLATHGKRLPGPSRVFSSAWSQLQFENLADWLGTTSQDYQWRLGSVNRSGLNTILNWIAGRNEVAHVVAHEDFTFPILAKEPDKVGIDRLAAAFAAHSVSRPDHAAIIVDAGTAITIDCVSHRGEFLGGAIAPGLQLSLSALTNNTDQLPQVQLRSKPPLIGDDTQLAIAAGVHWMTAFGVNGFIEHLRQELDAPCTVWGTGGRSNCSYLVWIAALSLIPIL